MPCGAHSRRKRKPLHHALHDGKFRAEGRRTVDRPRPNLICGTALNLRIALPIAIALASQVARAQETAKTGADSASAQRPGVTNDAAIPARSSSLFLVNSETVERFRLDQLRTGVAIGESLLLRSASSLTRRARTERPGIKVSAIMPQVLLVSNTKIPFSQNDGAVWAGRGTSSRTLFGVKVETPRVRLIVAPELVLSENADWLLRRPVYRVPSIPPERSGGGFVFPYYVASLWSIDQPLRLGEDRIQRLDLGQTTAMFSTRRFELGFSNENEWWGPGIRNAIVLSNNAPGFPHLFVRTARPLATRFGGVEARWLVGGLVESKYFDTVSTNNVRSLASFAATLQTAWNPNVSVGLARSVYSTATGWGQVPWRWFDVFGRTYSSGEATRPVPGDPPVRKDQLFSVFARWVFPASGLETYVELARLELDPSLRELFTAPNHTQGYTLGLQWTGPSWRSGSFRIHTELTQMEQGATFRSRPLPSWYMSKRVIQGYTHRGEILGASIGPGASSQWLAMDYIKPSWRFGGFVGRIRWNEDVHGTARFPIYVGYCSHDVSLYPGMRAAGSNRFGTITADWSFQNRQNAFFQNDGGCPNVGQRLDIRNRTLSITFSPFS